MNPKKISLIAGVSYLIIFLTAIFANFFMLEAITQNPLGTVVEHHLIVRLGIIAFLVAAVFDVVVAWALFELYQKHGLTRLSTYFRLIHTAIFGGAVFALVLTLNLKNSQAILAQVNVFNTLWLIGLFFFGIHLILLGKIIKRPKLIAFFLVVAGIMYIVDTSAHFLLADYEALADIFLAMVAIPSIIGEMALTIWLLGKGLKRD